MRLFVAWRASHRSPCPSVDRADSMRRTPPHTRGYLGSSRCGRAAGGGERHRPRSRCRRRFAAVGDRAGHPAGSPASSTGNRTQRVRRVRPGGRHALQRQLRPDSDSVSPGDPDDLPAVHFWSIWNEPDYGPSLAPQGDRTCRAFIGGAQRLDVPQPPRRRLDGASDHRTRRRHGPVRRGRAPRRRRQPVRLVQRDEAAAVSACAVLRRLPLPDAPRPAATRRGCPTTAAGSGVPQPPPRAVRRNRLRRPPVLTLVPAERRAHPDPDDTTLAEIGELKRALDRLQRVYGSASASRSGTPSTATSRARRSAEHAGSRPGSRRRPPRTTSIGPSTSRGAIRGSSRRCSTCSATRCRPSQATTTAASRAA